MLAEDRSSGGPPYTLKPGSPTDTSLDGLVRIMEVYNATLAISPFARK